MNRSPLLSRLQPALWLLIVALFLLPSTVAHAQTCTLGTIVVDGSAELDESAVCEAIGPWARDGYQVLVYVTDRAASSEDAWYGELDQVEADAGLRTAEGFFIDGVGLAVSTGSDAAWATTVTLGESLYNTPLDTDAGANAVRRAVRGGIAGGSVTDGIVQGLETAYSTATGINSADSTTNEASTGSGVGTTLPESAGSQTDSTSAVSESAEGGSALGWIIGGALGVGVIGGAGVYAWPRVVSPALARRRRTQALQAQLDLLQQRVANLLLACERLLDGSTPKDTVLYALFAAYGGDQYADLDRDVIEALRRSQEALRDAFDIRTRLVRPGVAAERTLEQQVSDWEAVYVTLVGMSPRIAALTDADLQTLLDPLQVLEQKPADVQLAAQLDTIRKELTGAPLRVELLVADPNTLDAAGILGNLDNVQATIGRLQAAEREAPERLNAIAAQRSAVQAGLPDQFLIDRRLLFGGIDARIERAGDLSQRRAYLDVLDMTDALEDDLDTLGDLVEIVALQQERDEQIAAVEVAGFRPKRLPALRRELAEDIAQLNTKLASDNFDSVRTWLDEYNADGETALAHALGWRDLHSRNAERLADARTLHAELTTRLTGEVTSAWQQLSHYPALNWQDVEPSLQTARDALQAAPTQLTEVDALNTMETQAFESAELRLTTTGAALAEAALTMDEVVGRLTAVQSAENSIDVGLQNTETDLRRATRFRDAEDRKIGPEVDTQIDEARRRLDNAARHRSRHEYLAALDEQQISRELATTAYRTASEQVAQINALQTELDALVSDNEPTIGRTLRAIASLPAVALTEATIQLASDANAALEQAQLARSETALHEDNALLAALTNAVAAYRETQALAKETSQRSRDDVRSYEQQMRRVQDMLAKAQRAINDAYATGKHRDAGNSWREMASKAERALPDRPDETMTRERLSRIETDAREAYDLAVKARGVAQQRINRRARERARRRLAAAGTIGRASSRRRSSSSRRRSTYRSSSRRSSGSFRSSRRSSSFGRSRRR